LDVLGYLLANDEFVAGEAPGMPDPVWLGARMAALYRCWDGPAGIDLASVTAGFLRRLNSLDAPIGHTCLQVAAAVAHWGGHDFHSARHHAEVATNAMVITELADRAGAAFPLQQRALLLASCLGHDIYYQLKADPAPRFSAEAHSASALDDIAARCRLDARERAALRCLILATEPGFRTCLAALLEGAASGDMPDGLDALASHPDLAALAGVLSDADLLSSAGLTEDWHKMQLGRLQRELGCEISPEEDLRFFDTVIGVDFLSRGGRVFSPNLARIRLSVLHAAISFRQ